MHDVTTAYAAETSAEVFRACNQRLDAISTGCGPIAPESLGEGSGHFRAKIYSKPEAPVMRQHTAKKQSIFHTELHASWSMKVLKIDMPYVSRQWRDLSWPPL